MKRLASAVALVLVATAFPALADPAAPPPADPAAAAAEKAAVPAAESWLALVDAGKYDDSWTAAALLFRQAVPMPKWGEMVATVRGPLGKLVSRKLESSVFTRTAPGAPDGEYEILTFRATYQHKKDAVETVTPMKDPDGKWRVSGYFIR